jgi:hypothetical protein
MEQTSEDGVFIEERRVGYVRYIRPATGQRWEIEGVCDMRGDCLVGSIDPLTGDPSTRLDVPVTPEFKGCCPLTGRWLS